MYCEDEFYSHNFEWFFCSGNRLIVFILMQQLGNFWNRQIGD